MWHKKKAKIKKIKSKKKKKNITNNIILSHITSLIDVKMNNIAQLTSSIY